MGNDDEDLLFRLCREDGYPVTPGIAALMIVNELLSDLTLDRKERIRNAIEEWGSEREGAVGATVSESTGER